MADGDIGDLVSDIVVLGIELTGDVIANMDTYAANILKLPGVDRAVRTQLTRLAQQQFEAASGTRPTQAPSQIAAQFAQDLGKAISGPAEEELKKLPKAQRLLKKIEDLQKALDKAGSVGIWHDKKVNVLYLIAAGAALGGAISLFVLKAGNVVSNSLLKMLDNKSVKFLTLGNVSVSGELLNFQTGKDVEGGRDFKFRTFATADWKPVTVTISVVGKAVGDHASVSGSADAKVVIPLSPGVTLTPSVHADTDGKVDLGVALGIKRDKLTIDVLGRVNTSAQQIFGQPGAGSPSAEVSGSMKYDTRMFGAPASIGVSASDSMGPKGNEAKVLGTFEIHF